MKGKKSESGSRRTCAASFGINQLCFGPGTQASPLERPDQRLFTPECDRQRQPSEMHAQWTLDVHEESGTADFAALQAARI
jgi:hypothetical protein